MAISRFSLASPTLVPKSPASSPDGRFRLAQSGPLGSGFAPRPAAAPGPSPQTDSNFLFSDLQRATRPLSVANTLTAGAIPGLGPGLSLLNLISRFSDPKASDARLALGTAGDVTGLAGSLANSQIGFNALGSSMGSLNAANLGQGLGAAGGILGLGSGALSFAEGNIPGGISGLAGGAAGLANAAGVLPAGAAAFAALPFAITALIANNRGEGLGGFIEDTFGIETGGGMKSLMKRKQKEAGQQQRGAEGALSSAEGVVQGGFTIEDILRHFSSPDIASNQGFLPGGNNRGVPGSSDPNAIANQYGRVVDEMRNRLAAHVASQAQVKGTTFEQEWANTFAALAEKSAGENRAFIYNTAFTPRFTGGPGPSPFPGSGGFPLSPQLLSQTTDNRLTEQPQSLSIPFGSGEGGYEQVTLPGTSLAANKSFAQSVSDVRQNPLQPGFGYDPHGALRSLSDWQSTGLTEQEFLRWMGQ